jgi:hypothetical protein
VVRNVHERVIETARDARHVGELIDKLSAGDDVMWPTMRWPAMRFDRPLAAGARGGHGPVRYTVEQYTPGRSVRFRFDAPAGFDGWHGFDLEGAAPGRVRVRHTLSMEARGAARLSWPLAFRPLHDACVEDALDRAEAHCTGRQLCRRPLSLRVRLLRGAARLLMR